MNLDMRKAIILSVGILLLSSLTALSAQSSEQLLQKAVAALRTDRGVAVAYQSEFRDHSGKVVSQSNGRIELLGRKFRLMDNLTAVYDGKTLAYYNREDNTLNYSSPSAEELAQINPILLFDRAERNFHVKQLPESKVGPIIALTPRVKSNFSQIEICLNRQNNLPHSINIKLRDKSSISVMIYRVDTMLKFPAGAFTLNPKNYAGAEIVDLR